MVLRGLHLPFIRIKIKIAFNPIPEKFEVQNPAILKDVSWLPNIADAISGEISILKLVRGYNVEFSLSAFMELINGVGFPIAVCIALFWFNRDTIREQQILLNELKDIIRDNSEVMRDLIEEIKRK